MGERSVLFQLAVVGLLALICGLLILIVVQNNDTQRKLESLRTELQARPAATLPAGDAGTAARPRAAAAPETGVPPAAPPGVKVTRGADGVDEYWMGGLRVRLQPYRNPQAVAGDRLVRSYTFDPPGLNPYIFNEAMCSALFGLCNDPLAARDFDDPERWVPRLATGWMVTQTVRVYLTPELDAAGLVQVWQAEADGAAARAAADIVELRAEDAHTLVLTTNSVRAAYAQWLEKRLQPKAFQPVQYLNLTLNPKFKPPANKPAPTLAALEAKIAAAAGGWRILERRARNANDHLFLVLGDGAGLAAAWAQALREAAPEFDPQKPESRFGTVEPLEIQPYDIRPTVTFALRPGVRWQTIADPREGAQGAAIEGPEVTSADYLFTFEKIIRNEQVPCEFIRNYMRDLDTVSAPDRYTVKFSWFRPYFQLFGISAGMLTPLPKHIFEKEDLAHLERSKFNRVICGNGPWKFKSWTADVAIELERNADYWGPPPHLTALVYKAVKDPGVNLSLFREGKLDALTLTPDQWREFTPTAECDKIARTESGVANSYRFVGYNEREPLFQDKAVRQALTMLVDRQTIIDQIFNGMATPLTGPFHPQTPNTDPAVKPLPFDLAGAQAVLARAGWKDTDDDGVIDKAGVPFRYTLLYPGGRPEFDQLAAFIQQSNRKAGIQTELAKLDWSAFIGRINQLEFQSCILGWQLGYEADPYQLWHSSQTEKNQSNFCGFKNARADAIIMQGRYTLDPLAREGLYREFHRLIAEEQPYTFLFVPKRMNLYARRYQDVKYTLLETDYSRWWVAAAEQK